MSVRKISSLLKNASISSYDKSNDDKCKCNESVCVFKKIVNIDGTTKHINIYKCNRINLEKVGNKIEEIEIKKDKYQIKQFISSVVSKKPCDYYREDIIKEYDTLESKEIIKSQLVYNKPKQLYFDELINHIISAIEIKTYPLNHYTGRLNNYLIRYGYEPLGLRETIEELKIRLKTVQRKIYVPNEVKKQIYEDRIASNSYRFKIKNNLDNSTQTQGDDLNNLLLPEKYKSKSKSKSKKKKKKNNSSMNDIIDCIKTISINESADSDNSDDSDEELSNSSDDSDNEKSNNDDNLFDIDNLSGGDDDIDCGISNDDFSD